MNLENWKQNLWYFFHSLIAQLLHPASQLIAEKSNTHTYGQFKVPSLPHMILFFVFFCDCGRKQDDEFCNFLIQK